MTKSKGILYKFGYPPYKIVVNDYNETFIVSGGGGASRTGVPNEIELFEFPKIDKNNQSPLLKNVAKFDTGTVAVMNMDSHFNYIITAEGKSLRESILYYEDEKLEDGGETKLRDRRKSECEQLEIKRKHLVFKTHRFVEQCFSDGSEVTYVLYGGRYGSQIIVGSSNGAVKVYWRFSEDDPLNIMEGRTLNDVSGGEKAGVVVLDVRPDGVDELVAVCERPGGRYARVWNLNTGSKVTELALTSLRGSVVPNQERYKFRNCRFIGTYSRNPSFLLFCTHQPTASPNQKGQKTRQRHLVSYLSVWGPLNPNIGSDYQLVDLIALGKDNSTSAPLVPSALSATITVGGTSDGCDCLMAVGSVEGQVDVYRLSVRSSESTRSQRIYRMSGAHSFLVTDLGFLGQTHQNCKMIVSTGVDNVLRLHKLPIASLQSTSSSWVKSVRFVWLMFLLWTIDRLLLAAIMFHSSTD